MYTDRNYQKKAHLIADLVAGKIITYHQPGPFGGNEPRDGTIYLEGPHYPQAHKWYAKAIVKDGRIVQVDKHKGPAPRTPQQIAQETIATIENGPLSTGAVLKDKEARARARELDEHMKIEGAALARRSWSIYD